ncbi:MAG: acyl-CoA dehydrogenase family protein [Aestuariivirgaceae bacterium]
MFTPHLSDLKHALDDINAFGVLVDANQFPDLSIDLVDAVLTEAGRFAAEVLAPVNRPGDVEGCRFDADAHSVTTASGWRDAYRQWREAGWAALPCAPEYGGQGLPISIGLAVQELWNTAASAFGIGTLLTQGAVEALVSHGSDELKARYLPQMVAGDWTGTMNLTEPHAGSDLSQIRTRAEPAGDGTYRITGTKIYITHGEHDLTENIIHLVLARLPDAPEGTRGISLFLVPKFHVDDDDGSLGARNDVKCIGIEHKMGIHGSPTCTMRYGDDGGAVGWLVGEENKGLNCMFTMMNNARLHVGMQGVAVAERACQQALAYANERKQGRGRNGDGSVPIIEHADVRRMLLDMKARTAAARAICYETARALDLAHFATDAAERDANAALGALLTPVAKAFGTDNGVEVASIGIQIHGGMGFIEETGAAQHMRDARITPIYEGTNGIQALDLVARKLPLENGDTLKRYLADKRQLAAELTEAGNDDLSRTAAKLETAIAALETATDFIAGHLQTRDERAIALATPYLQLFGLTAGGAGLARGALAAAERMNNNEDALRIRLARYFADVHLPHTAALRDAVVEGADTLVGTTPELLNATGGL